MLLRSAAAMGITVALATALGMRARKRRGHHRARPAAKDAAARPASVVGPPPPAPASPRAVVTAARVMLPDDTNPAGNVHGGSILRFMTDNGGMLAAQRYLTSAGYGKAGVALVGISQMDFWAPMFVGNLAEVEAQVTYVGSSSIEVTVKVYADNLQGRRRLTNEARLWYAAVEDLKGVTQANLSSARLVQNLPQLPQADEEAKHRYQEQKEIRAASDAKLHAVEEMDLEALNWTAELSQVMLPSDCYTNAFVQGGIILKLMDNAAGICAYRHCRSNVVTASLESLSFNRSIFNGNLVTVRARPTFASSKSLEVEVLVQAEDLLANKRWVAVHAFLVFVALDDKLRPKSVPPLPEPSSELEEREREAARERYMERKAKLKKPSK